LPSAGCFERLRVLDHLLGCGSIATLHTKTAGLVHGLRLQAEMRAHGDVMARKKFNDFDLTAAAFELHHLRRAFLHEAHGVGERVILRRIAHERHIRDQERAVQTACNGGTVVHDVIHRHRHRGAMTLDHHAHRIPDEHDICIALVYEPGKTRVIAGQRGDLLALRLHVRERAERYGWAGGVA
jgi:hypothetical protein